MSFINHNITPPAEVVIVTELIAVYERANLHMSSTPLSYRVEPLGGGVISIQ